MKGQSDYGKV